MENILRLYTQWCGRTPLSAEPIPKAGSNRHYFRLTATDGSSVIGVSSHDVEENRCFVHLARHFAARGLAVPQILAVSPDATAYLQTDLGRVSLYDALGRGRASGCYDEAERDLIRLTLRRLPHIQVSGAEGLDFGRCLAPAEFDTRAAMFDLNYFKYCFVRTAGLPFDELRLDDDFLHLAADLTAADAPQPTFLYRDFQARNVMLRGGEPWFIDFQGGRRGPLQYDVASFLWQASARFPASLREEMVDEYIDELSTLLPVDAGQFRQRLRLFVLFRLIQVLGAYGLRGRFERKQYFIDSIPPALRSLRELLQEGVAAPYPYLESLLLRLTEGQNDTKSAAAPAEATSAAAVAAPAPAGSTEKKAPLVVRIFSFSYKRGIPDDTSGNGGGYVFDCRSTHNPGRYAPYKQLTGLDEPVIRFLEDDGEIALFLQSVYRLADAHVERYMQRGFTDLMFSFGCTGGQHRSVYSAQHLAEHLHRKFGIAIHLVHREQHIEQTFPART